MSLGEVKGWEAFTTGRVNAFLTHINGDGNPAGLMPDRQIIGGGGLETLGDRIPENGPDGQPSFVEQGKVEKWRLRSGFLPNILGLGVRSQVAPDLKVTGQLSIWGTIESDGMRKYFPVEAEFREAFARLEGSWGAVTLGRTLSLYSRGIYLIARDYGHNYGVGYQARLTNVGPTGGMIGFGVLAASYNPGIYYTTPSLGGLAINIGVYDAVIFGAWNRSNTPRPETEITYDYVADGFKIGAFANGAFQKLYKKDNNTEDETFWGLGGGLRAEFGPVRVGGGGHYGRGVGLFYALDDAANLGTTNHGPGMALHPVTMAKVNEPNELRIFDGFSAFAQYAAGTFDINLMFGQSRAHQLDIDKLLPNKLIKTQTGIGAAFVFHANENLHLNVDYLRAMFRWYKNEKQDVNFINAGATIDW